LGVHSMSTTINLMEDNLVFKIPIYLIQGNEDLLIPKDVTKDYFDKIKAPKRNIICYQKPVTVLIYQF
jgi:esterase/lipase